MQGLMYNVSGEAIGTLKGW